MALFMNPNVYNSPQDKTLSFTPLRRCWRRQGKTLLLKPWRRQFARFSWQILSKGKVWYWNEWGDGAINGHKCNEWATAIVWFIYCDYPTATDKERAIPYTEKKFKKAMKERLKTCTALTYSRLQRQKDLITSLKALIQKNNMVLKLAAFSGYWYKTTQRSFRPSNIVQTISRGGAAGKCVCSSTSTIFLRKA